MVGAALAIATHAADEPAATRRPRPAAPAPAPMSTTTVLGDDRPAAVGALALRPADVEATDLTRYRVVVMNAWEWPRVAALKRAHPETIALVYKDMASTRSYAVGEDGNDDALLPTGIGYAAANGAHPEWFLHDQRGRRVEWSGYDDHWWMDVGSESYAAAWLAAVQGEVQANGWDGVMIDNAIVDPSVYLPGGASLAAYPDADAYRAATQRFLERVAPALRQSAAAVVVNLGGATPPAELYQRWATIAGGIMREHFARGGNDGKGALVAGDDWERQLEQQETAAAAGARYLAVSYSPPSDEAFLQYARASFLLGWDGDDTSALLVASPDPKADPWSDAWTADIGEPAEPRREVGGAWVRRFTGGAVAVNPTPRVVEVDPGLGERVMLPPRSGVVLRQP